MKRIKIKRLNTLHMSVREEEPFKSCRQKLRAFRDSLPEQLAVKFNNQYLETLLNDGVIAASASRSHSTYVESSAEKKLAQTMPTPKRMLSANDQQANNKFSASLNKMLKLLSDDARNFIPKPKRPELAELLKELAGIMEDKYGVVVNDQFYPIINNCGYKR